MSNKIYSSKEIKRVKRLVFFFIIILLLIPLWMFLLWYFQKEKPVKILIIDKTVAELPRQEHRGFNWILTYYKFSKSNKQLYNIYEDYFGFFPLEPIEDKEFEIHDFENFNFEELDSIVNNNDLIYFADNYGVYRNEWYLDTLETEHSAKVYGGLTEKEVYLAQQFKKQDKLILSEFNTFCSPTGEYIRKQFEETFDLEWSKWTCRYFDMLDTLKNPELPKWVVRLYKQQHNNQWPFHKSGLVFVHENSTLFILENETHLEIETPFIHTSEKYRKIYNLPDSIHYPFWFDITFSGDSNTVISEYKLYPNNKGDSILEVYGVPKVFPAVIEHLAPYTFYYLAGDYIDNPLHYFTCYFKGISKFNFFLYNTELNNRKKFHWKFYLPLISKIMNEYYTEKIAQNDSK